MVAPGELCVMAISAEMMPKLPATCWDSGILCLFSYNGDIHFVSDCRNHKTCYSVITH